MVFFFFFFSSGHSTRSRIVLTVDFHDRFNTHPYSNNNIPTYGVRFRKRGETRIHCFLEHSHFPDVCVCVLRYLLAYALVSCQRYLRAAVVKVTRRRELSRETLVRRTDHRGRGFVLTKIVFSRENGVYL